MNKFIIECDNVSKTYQDGKLSVEVLRNINFSVKKQESIAILGNSGSGKFNSAAFNGRFGLSKYGDSSFNEKRYF